jgi:hypothetical protein
MLKIAFAVNSPPLFTLRCSSMRKFAIALLVLGLASLALAQSQAPQAASIEIIDYGIFTLDLVPSNSTSAAGVAHNGVRNVRLAAQTTRIPLQKDVRFGYHFRLNGSPVGAKVNVKFVTVYPAPGMQMPGSGSPILRDESTRTYTLGSTYIDGYVLNHDWELIPGKWTFEVWQDNRELGSQSFDLTPSSANP